MSGKLIFNIAIILVTCRFCESSIEDFFKEQTLKVNTFFQDQFNYVEEAVSSNYEGVQTKVNGYIEEQQKKVYDDVKNYVDTVEKSGRNFVETYSFMPTEDPASILKNPESVLSVPSMITSNGYDCETHTVESEGFLLNIHRIPRPKNGGVTSKNTVLLQHGLFASSADWILNGPQRSLAYILSDAGYDVWMANIRGNKYSKEHSRYKVKTKEYWNFSWHEVAAFDIPAVIDYIHRVKGEDTKIAYIGHSMGTTILFTMLSLRPEYNNKLSGGIALAPEVFLSNMKSPIKSLASIANSFAHTEMIYGSYEFIPKESFFGRMHQMCEAENMSANICNNVIFYLCGEDQAQFNKSLQHTFVSNLGTGTSWKTAVHMSQMVLSGKFQPFDYGYEERNQRMYGSKSPPEYNLSKATLNITLFWSKNDLMSNEIDVRKLHEILPNSTQMYLVPFNKFNHVDYLWAIDAPRLINDKVLEILEETFQNKKQDVYFTFRFGR